jgi:hypothetical protein
MSDPRESVENVLTRALTAYDVLTELGETIEDEWSYVTDLSDAWRAALETEGAARAGRPASSRTASAVAAAIAEIDAITDPHRAIDWLSTFPQVVLLALEATP